MAEIFTGPAFYFFQAMLLILLAVVGALVLWLHFQFRRFKQVNNSMPLLSETLAQNLLDVQKAMQEMSAVAREQMPELESKISEAKSLVQEIEYVLSRGEKVVGTRPQSIQSQEKKKVPESVDVEKKETDLESDQAHTSAQSLVERIVQKEVSASKPAARRMAPAYGAQAYGAALQRDAGKSSENEADLRRILEGRL